MADIININEQAIQKYQLPIFGYVPNLKVVGTYHGLNDNDKEVLEDLIIDSDFVALEYDRFRARNKGKIMIWHSWYTGLLFDGTVHASYFKYNYIIEFLSLNNRGISNANENLSGDNETRDVSSSEFLFCIEKARYHGKSLYLVDIPLCETLVKLSSLPFWIRRRHLKNMREGIPEPPEVKKIFVDDREDHMLCEIEREEKESLENLTRKGILVTGIDHSTNYYKNYEKSLR